MNNRQNNFLSNIPVVVKNLIFINLILLILTEILRSRGIVDLYNYLGLHLFSASKFNPAQLITYMFMHGDFWHVFFNMFSLFMFGSALERYWGPKRFLIFYMVTGIGAGLVQELVWYADYYNIIAALNEATATNSPEVLLPVEADLRKFFDFNNLANFNHESLVALKDMFLNAPLTIGASGAVFGILLAFGMLFPNTQIFLIFFPIPFKAKYFVIFYALVELYAGVFKTGDGIAHFAHLGGMIFGYILIRMWRKKGFT